MNAQEVDESPTEAKLGGSVTVNMNAPVDKVWGLISDISRIGEFSPETFEAHWAESDSDPGVGSRFRGHVKRNQRWPTYWTTCVVTIWEPDQTFAFAVLAGNTPLNNWRYDLKPFHNRTEVTQSFHLKNWLPSRIYWALLGTQRSKTNVEGMRTTLHAMRSVLENSPGANI